VGNFLEQLDLSFRKRDLIYYHVEIIKLDVITVEWIFHHEEIRYNFVSLDIFLFDALYLCLIQDRRIKT